MLFAFYCTLSSICNDFLSQNPVQLVIIAMLFKYSFFTFSQLKHLIFCICVSAPLFLSFPHPHYQLLVPITIQLWILKMIIVCLTTIIFNIAFDLGLLHTSLSLSCVCNLKLQCNRIVQEWIESSSHLLLT